MSKFIKIDTLHGDNPRYDKPVYIRTENVHEVMVAHDGDRKQRKEVNTLIVTPTGAFATAENHIQFLDRLAQIEV